MTLTLTLFRHAKATRDELVAVDADRSLAERGRLDAPRMGEWLAECGCVPDLVLCSTARRTRETAEAALPRLPPPPPVRFEAALYLASARTLLGFVRRASGDVRHLMLIGHNPGLHELALDLSAGRSSALRRELEVKLPTAGVVVLRLDGARWSEVGTGCALVLHFGTPKRVASQKR